MKLLIAYIVFQVVMTIIVILIAKKILSKRVTELQSLYDNLDSYTHKAKLSGEQVEEELRASEEYLKKMADKFADNKLDELMQGTINDAMTEEINEQVASVFQQNIDAEVKEAIGAKVDKIVQDADRNRDFEEFNASHPSSCMIRMCSTDIAELQYLMSSVFDQEHPLLIKLRRACMNVCFIPCRKVASQFAGFSEIIVPVDVTMEKSKNSNVFKAIKFEYLRFDAERDRWFKSTTVYTPDIQRSFTEGGYHRTIYEMCKSYGINTFIATMLSDDTAYSEILKLHPKA